MNRRLLTIATLVLGLSAMLGLSSCNSGVPYSSANPLVYDYWQTPYPSWRFNAYDPVQKCGPPGQGRKVYVDDGNYVTYREYAVTAAQYRLWTVRQTSRPGPGSTTLYHAYENGYSRHATVRGCDNTGYIGDGRVYVGSSKVSRSVTWQCQGPTLCTGRQHGSWTSGWK